jgi:hypothetical protein
MMASARPLRDHLGGLLAAALESGEATALEADLCSGSGLPGPRMNLRLAGAFADVVAALAGAPEPPVAALERLLDGWAALAPAAAPVNEARVILPATAALTYGAVGAARPDWRDDELGKLRRAAGDSRWRVREMVAAGLQRMLAADWPATLGALRAWIAAGEPLVARAAAAAVAEPALLTTPARAADALAIQAAATGVLRAVPAAGRGAPDARALRQALGYTWSVAVATNPAAGFPALEDLCATPDADLRWIVRENARKGRLARWPAQVARLRAATQGAPAPMPAADTRRNHQP